MPFRQLWGLCQNKKCHTLLQMYSNIAISQSACEKKLWLLRGYEADLCQIVKKRFRVGHMSNTICMEAPPYRWCVGIIGRRSRLPRTAKCVGGI